MAKIEVSFKVISPDNIILVARELSNLTAIVYSKYFASSPSQHNETIPNVNPVMHRIQIYSTPDGVTLGALKGSCDIDASIVDNTAFNIFSFIVDGASTGTPNYDPPSGQGVYNNPDLVGKTYTVFKAGYGPLIPGYHIDFLPGGGFQYIDGQQFSPAEEYTLMVSNIIQTHITSSGKGFPDGIMETTLDFTFDSTYYNKMTQLESSANQMVIFSSLASIPDGTMFGFSTHKFTGVNVILKLPALTFCVVNFKPRSPVYLGRGETITLFKKGSELVIINWDGDYRRIGERVSSDSTPPYNALPEVGGWYLMTEYVRAYEWYVQELAVGNFFTGTDDVTPSDADKGKWGVGSLKFWVPDRRNMFDRSSDGTRQPGALQPMDVQQHFHAVGTQNVATTPNFNRATGGGLHPVRSWSATGQIDASQAASTDFNIGVETRPVNIADIKYRII